MKQVFKKMRALLIVAGMMLLLQQVQAQQPKRVWLEDFDGTLPPANWVVAPQGSWEVDETYYLPGSSQSNPQSYLGLVPHRTGDSSVLLTAVYDFTDYEYVLLKFSHICKVSPQDRVR